ncbi:MULTISPECIES: D-alanyl-D-alanine carboxypeptidase family protein [unclassified Desulfovibrio]|uniref:D-alanyl-D-alanine carboxypeptidase family protein n=1 Tax=unclassified Desulfovibrio TaxID=2593640 RepID=UPI001F151C31|nr:MULTISPECIES: D-alanyl-D-alanine carboxypeptidase family protein [unclassified Desulfovibrio]
MRRYPARLSATCLLWLLPLLGILLLPAAGLAAGVPARSAILVNMDTGRVLYEKNADSPIPPASLTKIMTMYLALDAVKARRLRLDTKVRVPAAAASVGGSSMHLQAGDTVPLVRLLAGMAVVSGNDAAMAVAARVGGDTRAFVRQMNGRARNLGLSRTTFKNPTGLPAAGQKTSARDMMRLCLAYLKAHPSAMRFHGMRNFLHRGLPLRNTNALLGTMNGVNGLKTGWTVASGYNLVVTAQRGKTRLLAVVLGAGNKEQRDAAARRMLEAGFSAPRDPQKVAATLAGTRLASAAPAGRAKGRAPRKGTLTSAR